MRNNQGFTLIELMIVVAIISILAAMILPAVPTAEHEIGITPTVVTSRYNGDFEEEVGIVATKSQGDFIIFRSISLENHMTNHINEHCDITYGTRYFGKYNVIITAQCE